MGEFTGVKAPERAVQTWRRSYARRVAVTDAAIITASVFGAQLLRFGLEGEDLSMINRPSGMIAYSTFSLVIIVTWMLALKIYATRDAKIIGNGATEYKRVADATLRFFGVVAILAFVFQVQVARGYLLLAFPLGLCLVLFGRWYWRKWLLHQRHEGRYTQRAVLVGERQKSRHAAQAIGREGAAGIEVIGAITECCDRDDLLPGIPLIGDLDHVLDAIEDAGADTVVFTGSDDISPADMQQLGWELEQRRIDLLVAPALTDIAGPRIHARPVAGLPLIHVDYPRFEGHRYLAKRTFDIVAATAALILLSPLFLILAITVRHDGGPALFRQQRVGLSGKPFQMIKFRTMVVDAEDQLPTLLDRSEGNGLLFKLRNDPRVTAVGRVLRRYSLDELPQIVNVLRGDMSFVGPRPPLGSEVARYDGRLHRRLLVKPGITGLWQTSGRSDLSLDDSVRLDLFYVENWSLTGDLMILWRTLNVVARAQGAY
ncbi:MULTISPECIES: sugar transferase [unclassified Microbacterium]|uniref:sugar transferase n=1 Tax=unclassified Microbacterium TaxID=2609290 RepID=UPI002FCCD8F5